MTLVDPPSVPGDIDAVRYAFRLGWAVSELRGRYRPCLFAQPLPAVSTETATGSNPLPLAGERTSAAVRIEIRETVYALASSTQLELKVPALEALVGELHSLEAQRTKILTDEWEKLADLFWSLDAELQDKLELPATQAAAYQLGRGLADTYWALQTAEGDTSGSGSWTFVFGEPRQLAINRSARRLSPYLGAAVIAAISGSFGAWRAYLARVQDGEARAPEEQMLLYKQSLLWRDLVRGERLVRDLHDDPDTPTATGRELWRRVHVYREAILPVLPPLVFGLAASGFLIYAATSLVSGSFGTTILSVLAGLGVTTASLYARAKAQLLNVFSVLRDSVQTERARVEASYAPAPLKGLAQWRTRARRALRRQVPGKPAPTAT